jgi:hypothetical protein
MSQQNQISSFDGKANQEQTNSLLAMASLEDGQGERLLVLSAQVSFYYNSLVKEGHVEPYIALQLTQSFQTTLMRGG